MIRLPKSVTGLLALLALTVLFALFPHEVFADYNSALSDYKSQYSNYRQAYSNFSVAKSTFLTYKTLTAQNAAIVAFRDVLNARNGLVSSYFDVMQEKLNSTPGVDPIDLQTFTGSRKSTKDWLSGNQAKIRAAGTLTDLNSASEEFSSRYPQMQQDMRKSIGRLLLAKGTNLDNALSAIFAETNQVSSFLKTQGEDTTGIDRGVIQAKIKRDLFAQKQQEERDFFFPKYDSNSNDLLQGQQLAIEANQYLKEATSYLVELFKPVFGN